MYLSCHPDDLTLFLEEYGLNLLQIQDCAIWYETEYDAPYEKEELAKLLSQMKMIVMPVTTKLLKTPNRAMDVEYVIAQEKHIPVLPIMMESGLDDEYAERFGNLRYINACDAQPAGQSFTAGAQGRLDEAKGYYKKAQELS